MSERLPRIISKALIVSLGLVSLAACSEGRDPESISRCIEKSQSDIPAEIGANNENDPQVLLDFIEKESKKNHLDSKGEGWLSTDDINGMGEVICRVANENGHTKQLFLLQDVLDAREEYLSQADRVLEEFGVTTTTEA